LPGVVVVDPQGIKLAQVVVVVVDKYTLGRLP
jgi:hypothetical protein